MPPKTWKTISTRPVYQNKWIKVREDLAEMPDGKQTIYGEVECSGAVGILPFLDDERVSLMRQYHYVFGENHRWEIPTGGVEPGKSLEQAAIRELREEIGYTANGIKGEIRDSMSVIAILIAARKYEL